MARREGGDALGWWRLAQYRAERDKMRQQGRVVCLGQQLGAAVRGVLVERQGGRMGAAGRAAEIAMSTRNARGIFKAV